MVLPGCNTDLGEETKNNNEKALGLVIGDEGNFTPPTPTPTPNPDPVLPATAAPSINVIPATIGNNIDLRGSAEPESAVRVVSGEGAGGGISETTVADGTGSWLIELREIPAGPISFTAFARADGKEISPGSEPRVATVRAPLAPPIIDGPVGTGGVVSGIGAFLSGTAEEGAIVAAAVAGPALGDGGRDLGILVATRGTTGGQTVDADGRWTSDLGAELATPLSVNGTYRAVARAVIDLGDGGFISSEDSTVFPIVVRNSGVPAAPTIVSIDQAEEGFLPLTISGTAEPGGVVALFMDEADDADDGVPWRLLEETTADGDGNWSYVLAEIRSGRYYLAARGKNPENFYGDSSEVVNLEAP